ncbi:MAG: DUF1223 domain-containing protein [Rhizobiaceae bacterium]
MQNLKTRARWIATALALSCLSVPPADSARAAEIHQAKGVVELFTSQGCSSCPAADEVLKELADRKGDVLTLAWHVDYWDYLGWKDTFGSEQNSDRQRAYARSLGERQIYTPQAIINGRMHVVGSRSEAVNTALEEFEGTANGIQVPIEVRQDGDTLKISVAATAQSADATLWMVYYDDHRDVDVERGENRGQKLAYTNIVRAVEMIGMVKDRDIQTEFKLGELGRRGHDSCALILQKNTSEGTPGAIVGAAFIQNFGI